MSSISNIYYLFSSEYDFTRLNLERDTPYADISDCRVNTKGTRVLIKSKAKSTIETDDALASYTHEEIMADPNSLGFE